ncbi:G2/mitotic-specific cyclin cdc13 [Neolecta irregularis DAH-3]|uniref:G2/mitotic-specific cyclin cdc13 n=1 Tax=Neolecta irregularis (strain DAH-3) TaxID=1198029 RepID=A0A1U7LVJ7_NEOID|nr:G2/mitotic-specific cyclin cdc13 [Neolecta irregularis DAH-3]|eukprot:OLL26700.1 G2/mitotic-specific cyclin cdc13 [Neolecta irregularis DAH-3]
MTTRVTRAKSGSGLVSKQSSTIAGGITRKRAALGDVSNVNKENAKAVLKAAAAAVKPRITTRSSSTSLPKVKEEASVAEPAKKKRTNTKVEAPGSKHEPTRKKIKVSDTKDWDDLDAEDASDPLMVSEYVVEIFDYMNELEISTLPNPDYMATQKDLQWSMRGILVDWLIEVHAKFRLLPETLFLAINIIDRFLSLRVVSLAKLQLVGITAMFIAAKYEEVLAPSIQSFVYMADNGYTDDEILTAERYVLGVLDFNLSYPNPMNFLRRNSKADNYDIQTRTVAKYFMEISCLDHRFLKYPPSMIAAAGMYLARRTLYRGDWDANLVHYSGYKESEIKPVEALMLDYLGSEPVRHDAFFKKYANKKFMKASIFVRDWLIKHGYSKPSENGEDRNYKQGRMLA